MVVGVGVGGGAAGIVAPPVGAAVVVEVAVGAVPLAIGDGIMMGQVGERGPSKERTN